MKKRRVSGDEVVKTLTKEFGFYFVKQKGSHIKLRKFNPELPKIVTTIVPDHKELDYGTLRGVLRFTTYAFNLFHLKVKEVPSRGWCVSREESTYGT